MCESAIIPRQLEYEHFPNFRTIYHGQGATSYQNVNVNNNYGGVSHSSNYVDEALNDFGLTVHHDPDIEPILGRANELGHVDQSNAEISTINGFLPSYHHNLETEDHPYFHEYYENHFDNDHGHHI
ncbi:hypothetical protein M0802_004468 [Mischocyttarus mexicanus]|nr:hypothetical protein M0802_004468 [Mischocyttarus mexicanus]